MKTPEDLKEFMIWFKYESEKYFETIELEKDVLGLQHQRGTKWKKGLTTKEIIDFQNELGFEFPNELIEFYKMMNGTDLPGINVYAEQELSYYYAPIYFSYPEHLPEIKLMIKERLSVNKLTTRQMRENEIPFIFPISDFYFMIVNYIENPIYYLAPSYHNHDINQPYVYGSLWTDSLQSFLIKDAFHRTDHINDREEYPDKQRVENYWTTKNDS